MKIDVSIGELVDKVTILTIKLLKIQNEKKRAHVQKEYDLLKPRMEKTGVSEKSEFFKRLFSINLKLWEIENAIRQKEAEKTFDEDFIQLARSVYLNNDQRAAIKLEINKAFGSDLIEEKEYSRY